jgi:hypothetical protein
MPLTLRALQQQVAQDREVVLSLHVVPAEVNGRHLGIDTEDAVDLNAKLL